MAQSSSACPKCGKPLRPGAKFCGSCGHVLTAAPAAPSPAAAVAAPPPTNAAAQAGGPPCPHCGKPLRPGAKFCNNCGKSITPSGPIVASPPPVAATPPPAAAVPPPPALSRTPAQRTGSGPVDKPQQARMLPQQPKPAAAVKRPPRKGLRLAIISAALVLCLAGVVGGYFALDNFDLLPGFLAGSGDATATTEVAAATTVETTEKPAATTQAPPPTQEPVEQASPTPVTPAPASPTETQPSVTETPTGTPVGPEPRLLFEENFSTALPDLWDVWGDPAPRIDDKVTPPVLNLTAGDNAAAAGITSDSEVPFKAGAQVEFRASLHPVQALPLKFYWDKTGYIRKNNAPKDGGSGAGGGNGTGSGDGSGSGCIGIGCPPSLASFSTAFHFPWLRPFSLANLLSSSRQQVNEIVGINLNIVRGNIEFSFPGKTCTAPVTTKAQHTYRIRLITGAQPGAPPKVELAVDDSVLPDCTGIFNQELEGGQITFTGHGILYSVKVWTP